jgi:hypothetical protein
MVLFALPAAAFDNYHLKREVPVPGGPAGWDYVVFDGGRLFVGHRPEGLQVFDIANDFRMTAVENTKGSNGAMPMPDLDLAVSHNNDGTLTLFRLSTMRTERQVKVGAELDSSRYDPVTHRLAVFGVPGESKTGSDVVIFQAPELERIGAIRSESGKLENSVADGAGNIFVAAQDLNAIVRLDMKELKQTAQWPTTGCRQPTGLAYDPAGRRLLVGCRGESAEPVFVVMNADTGSVVFKAPIGQGNDGVVFDGSRKRVILTNGVGANMVIFEQVDPDTYKLEEVVGTRANARTLALDPSTGDVYTVAAEGIFDASKKNLSYISPFYPNTFSPNSFRILQYGRQ